MQTGTRTATNRPRYRLTTNDKIDICRGVFAYLVVVAHALEVTLSMCPIPESQLGPVARQILVGSVGTGIYWVMGFFVISGYCIQLSVHRLAEHGSFSLRTYLIARMTRILPLYYLALLFAVLAEWWIAPARPHNWPDGLSRTVLACQALLIQNLSQTYGSFSPSWSITNEAFYYVLYGLLVAAAARWGRRPIQDGMILSLGIGFLMFLLEREGLRSPALMSTAMLFGLGAIWFLGALLAAHRDEIVGSGVLRAGAGAWVVILLSSIGLRCTYVVGTRFVLMTSGLAFALMMVRFLVLDDRAAGETPDVPAGPRTQAIIRGLGLSSYPTYLFHGPLMMIVGSVLIRLSLVSDWRWVWLLLASSGIATGIAGGYLVEEPLMAWRAGFLRKFAGASATSKAGTRIRRPIPAAR